MDKDLYGKIDIVTSESTGNSFKYFEGHVIIIKVVFKFVFPLPGCRYSIPGIWALLNQEDILYCTNILTRV